MNQKVNDFLSKGQIDYQATDEQGETVYQESKNFGPRFDKKSSNVQSRSCMGNIKFYQ